MSNHMRFSWGWPLIMPVIVFLMVVVPLNFWTPGWLSGHWPMLLPAAAFFVVIVYLGYIGTHSGGKNDDHLRDRHHEP
ncbi:MAG: hypothetical protein M0003_10425 [Acidithiobacillus sp.]|nr:hypothetical protein [Acidithiobacillus sp.]